MISVEDKLRQVIIQHIAEDMDHMALYGTPKPRPTPPKPTRREVWANRLQSLFRFLSNMDFEVGRVAVGHGDTTYCVALFSFGYSRRYLSIHLLPAYTIHEEGQSRERALLGFTLLKTSEEFCLWPYLAYRKFDNALR
ncbi:hypothetical protein DYU11_19865 [Fibrisoma montanum]|uniref:Uncharacterized protein n=1 Tax=Fibrisoma montanum TaxID=2305895 RepID=A0A418M3I2_9BACT|nr:hypothetical protein [Fibrisoma montanum]RIV20310.1 hypothetical protein DYU11_19865 [Fibrisoma montanum]